MRWNSLNEFQTPQSSKNPYMPINTHSSPSLFLVQEREELILGKEHISKWGDDLVFIACTASAIDGLRGERYSYQLLGDFCDTKLDWEAKERLILLYGSWCRRIDEIIREESPDISKLNLSPMIHNFASKRVWFFQYLVTIDYLHNLAENYAPCNVYFYSYVDCNEYISPISDVVSLFGNDRQWGLNFVPIVSDGEEYIELKRERKKRNVHVTREENSRNFPDFNSVYDPTGRTVWSALMAWSRKQAETRLKLTSPINNTKSLLQAIACGRLKLGGPNILVLASNKDNVAPVLRSLRNRTRKINFIFWDELVPDVRFNYEIPTDIILKRIEQDKYIRTNFVCWRGVDFFQKIVPVIKQMLGADIAAMYQSASLFNRLHSRVKIDAVVSAYDHPPFEAIFQQCASLKVPHFVFPHGGNFGVTLGAPVHQRYVREGSDYHISLSFSDTTKEHAKAFSEKHGVATKAVSVGSPYFHSLWKNRKSNKAKENLRLNVCFVLGAFTRSSDNNVGILHDSNMYQLLLSVVDKFAGTQNMDLFVKSGYGFESYGTRVCELVRKQHNLHLISSSKRIRDIISTMDIFLLPSISSPFVELSCTDAPVIALYDKRTYALTVKAESLIRRKYILVETVDEFFLEIDQLLQLGTASLAFDSSRRTNVDYCLDYNLCKGSDPEMLGVDQLTKLAAISDCIV
jgi:hypothetical protein